MSLLAWTAVSHSSICAERLPFHHLHEDTRISSCHPITCICMRKPLPPRSEWAIRNVPPTEAPAPGNLLSLGWSPSRCCEDSKYDVWIGRATVQIHSWMIRTLPQHDICDLVRIRIAAGRLQAVSRIISHDAIDFFPSVYFEGVG